MSFEVRELVDSARQVVNGLGIAADEESSWQQLVELGWLMATVPEALGGLGMGIAGCCALQGELGRGLGTAPLLPALLAVEAVAHGDLPERESWLERLMSGETYAAAPLADAALTVRRDGDGKQLSGLARAVLSADRASHAVVCTADGALVALVDLRRPGVGITARPTWDETRRLFDLHLVDVALDPAAVVATGAAAERLSRRLGILRDFGLAADAVGGAAALLERTVEYLQTRRQFGRPLAMFQALKHRCADLKAMTEAADALLWDNLGRVGDLAVDAGALAEADNLGRTAKQLACDAYTSVAEEALQLHGGIGMTSEHECHLFLKRAMLDEHLGRPLQQYDAGVADRFLAGLA